MLDVMLGLGLTLFDSCKRAGKRVHIHMYSKRYILHTALLKTLVALQANIEAELS